MRNKIAYYQQSMQGHFVAQWLTFATVKVNSICSPSLLLYLPPRVLRLTGNFYILSSWRSGVFSSCCLALDSSSSFPCPAFRPSPN
ncbi:hypothetical protein STEG23_014752, partial [Scotinomys teguina]